MNDKAMRQSIIDALDFDPSIEPLVSVSQSKTASSR